MTQNIFVKEENQFITPCECQKNILYSKTLRPCMMIANIMGVA